MTHRHTHRICIATHSLPRRPGETDTAPPVWTKPSSFPPRSHGGGKGQAQKTVPRWG